ncbi:folylpolyglutamate synthase [Thermodesulfovibrio yellowstonii DSM 11347]|uniref:Dihydrofolate synthase/folylpolyglutamate synthase n=2 Tax=Thermodesulfovibrionaceae TaxID=2811504 RepID=B5YJI6_THEYD|nr:folylpolyglutamate synthase/dihydrofolate synthase family protein [Thermodesulfovibrio islandicus]ACI20181.1 folylpolyglutamate synthase [Thermodesulfovibrio yellowstonii DSM 11347]
MTKRMKYKELINELYKKRTNGIKLGLNRVISVLEKLGNPHHSFKSIHIAGTNGKGSVSKIIYCLIRAQGLSVGLFTSPHLTRFTERIIVNDIEISEEEVEHLIEKIKPFSDELTFFEYVTVMALQYFKEKGIEYAVIETGMGGRLDATNVVNPLISVITNIGLDHQEFLGADLASIAKEKAGIIKNGIPVVSSSQKKEVEKVIIKKAEEMESPLFIYDRDFIGVLKSMSLEGIVFDFYPFSFQPSTSSLQSNLFLPLTGFHQLENVSVALKAFINIYPMYNENAIKEGLKNVKIPGRLEIIYDKPLAVFDIAHNPDAAEVLIKSLKTLTDKKPVVVFAMMRDKNVNEFIKCFENYAYKMIFTVPNYERALTYKELLKRLNDKKIDFVPEPLEAFRNAISLCKNNSDIYVLCTGSAYLVGEIKERLGEKTLHRSLGEIL